MDPESFKTFKKEVKDATFNSSMSKMIMKAPAPLSGPQLHSLLSMLMGGSDAVNAVKELQRSNKILPMSSGEAKAIVKDGTFDGDQKKILEIIAPLITDRDTKARKVFKDMFVFHTKRIDELFDMPGPQLHCCHSLPPYHHGVGATPYPAGYPGAPAPGGYYPPPMPGSYPPPPAGSAYSNYPPPPGPIVYPHH